ncbi:hypothetical protein FA95DRAFT_636925 [Auriscalpium vulgare]|uniref:Uncharacterized protein n=1 Tax=Auriscalpium vulgare TaxID=40419 RepID=A0ACB8RCR2_9AGAM|nr:hypothetical protein FA95DRAFT_636925 [Auriscalpium vulgare]
MPPRRRPTAFEVSFGEEESPNGGLEAPGSFKRKAPPDTAAAGLHNPKRPNSAESEAPVRPPPPPRKYYTPRPGEILEAHALIVGEDEVPDDGEDKPVRVLDRFCVFDPQTFEMVSLEQLEVLSDRAFEAAGYVMPHFLNDEDAGQEDELDEDYEAVRVRLSAILRCTVDCTKQDDPIYLETTHAWYILRNSSKSYRAFYQPFWTTQKITQHLLYTATSEPTTSYVDFLEYLRRDILRTDVRPQDFRTARPRITDEIATSDNAADLRASALVQAVLECKQFPTGIPSTRSVRHIHMPIRDLSDSANDIDLAVLRPEHQNPTHVTPLIEKLAHGLFRESLVVVGDRPARPDKAFEARRKSADAALLVDYVLAANADNSRRRIAYPDVLKRVRKWATQVYLGKEQYSIGDVIIVTQGRDENRPNDKVPELPTCKEALKPNDTLANFFWFAKIISIKREHSKFHIQWFEHSSRTFLGDMGNPRELFLTFLCQDLSFDVVVGKIRVTRVDDDNVPEDLDGYFYRLAYHCHEASFIDIPPPLPVEALLDEDPEAKCPPCNYKEQEGSEDELVEIKDGVAYRSENYHKDDYVLFQGEDSPAKVGQITSTCILECTATVSLLGCVAAIEGLPNNILKDERHLFLTQEKETVPVDKFLRKVFVFLQDAIVQDLAGWRAAHLDHYYATWTLPSVKGRWSQRRLISNFSSCSPCIYQHQDDEELADHIRKMMARSPMRILDLFSGVGALSLGLERSLHAQTSHAVEISPSAARTLCINSPSTIVYNQCANEVLSYAIKQHKKIPLPHGVPLDVLQSSVLPPPPKPEEIDIITAGFPCQPHSRLNMFQKANDVKSNLILNLLSWVDFLRPNHCVFENVRGFLSFSLNTVQADQYGVEDGIEMGGLKFVVHALVSMNSLWLTPGCSLWDPPNPG